MNIYRFSKEFSVGKYVPFLEAYCKCFDNSAYYEQILAVLSLLDKAGLKALPLEGEKWYEIDDMQDLDIAETLFGKKEGLLPVTRNAMEGIGASLSCLILLIW